MRDRSMGRRRSPLLVVAVGLSLLAPSAADAATRSINYSIAKAGPVDFDMRTFARIVDATLNDPRGWSLGGSLAFKRVSRSSIQVTLAAPSVVGRYAGCSRVYSCRVGSRVLINAERWAKATPTYRGEALLHSYRQMVINHEVGHALGFGHPSCSGPGRSAPVMQQQSIALRGCKRNVWPLASERSTLARRRGVAARQIPPSLVLGEQVGRIRLGTARSAVRAQLGSPTTSGNRDGVAEETYRHLTLEVRYRKHRVHAVTTRSSDDRSRDGIRVGLTLERLRRLLPDLDCVDQGPISNCTAGRAESPGDQRTTFVISDGRLEAIGIERTQSGSMPTGPA